MSHPALTIQVSPPAPKLDELPDVLDVLEAARVLRVSRNTLYDRIAEGEVPAIRMGRKHLIPKVALRAMLAGQDWRAEFPHACQLKRRA
jgi:excisionase family DNA binding protein